MNAARQMIVIGLNVAYILKGWYWLEGLLDPECDRKRPETIPLKEYEDEKQKPPGYLSFDRQKCGNGQKIWWTV